MLLTELALQNVRGFSPSARVPLQPGYWVLQVPVPQTAPFATLLSELCFPSGSDKALMAAGAKAAKAGVLMLGNDQTRYRLMRELGGGGALHRLPAGAQAYEAITTDFAEITRFLEGNVGVPAKTVLEQLFCFTSAQLPSRRPARPKTGAKAGTQQSAWASMLESAGSGVDPAAKLKELEKELELAKEIEALQFRMDGVSSQVFQAESELKGTDELESQLKTATTAWQAAPTPELMKLPADILARVERMPQVEAKFQEAMAKLEEDRALEEASVPPAVPPLTKDARFWGGMGAGVVMLGLGAFLNGLGHYVALLDIPAFGAAAVFALQYVDEVEKAHRFNRRGSRIAEREKKLLDQYNAEAAPVKHALQVLGVEHAREVAEVFGRKALLGAKVEELKSQLDALREHPDYKGAAQRLATLRSEQEAINAELVEKGAYVRDGREIERDMAKAREALSGKGGAGAAAGAAVEDPMPALMAQASLLFGSDVVTVASLLKDRAAQYIGALTDKRFGGIELSREGAATVVGPFGKVPLDTLQPKDVDWVYLAVRLTLLEKYSARYKVPIFMDSVLDGMEEAKLPLLGKMLKQLGTLTQVLQVSGLPAFAQAADGKVNL